MSDFIKRLRGFIGGNNKLKPFNMRDYSAGGSPMVLTTPEKKPPVVGRKLYSPSPQLRQMGNMPRRVQGGPPINQPLTGPTAASTRRAIPLLTTNPDYGRYAGELDAGRSDPYAGIDYDAGYGLGTDTNLLDAAKEVSKKNPNPEKVKAFDKEKAGWLSLAQAGFSLGANRRPDFLGALSEAGGVGIGSFIAQKKAYRDSQRDAIKDRYMRALTNQSRAATLKSIRDAKSGSATNKQKNYNSIYAQEIKDGASHQDAKDKAYSLAYKDLSAIDLNLMKGYMDDDASLTAPEAYAMLQALRQARGPKHPVWRSDGSFGKPE